jgi:hypothetical protein
MSTIPSSVLSLLHTLREVAVQMKGQIQRKTQYQEGCHRVCRLTECELQC